VSLRSAAAVRLARWARGLRRDAHALHLAARDPRVPWCAKLLALAVAGYALSPIDLIPDVIPVLGQLDDLVLVPFGIWAVVKLVPAPVMAELRERAERIAERPTSRLAAAAILVLWAAAFALVLWLARGWWSAPD
jgi:uncharacterized membrane protein YkvA (DUF1232 family)